MDSSTRIALGFVGAALILLFGGIAYHEFERQRDIDEVQTAMHTFVGGVTAVSQQSQEEQAFDFRQRQLAADRDQQRHMLGDNQRCLGGVVLQVDGTSYTQLGSISNPVRCSGGLADRALR